MPANMVWPGQNFIRGYGVMVDPSLFMQYEVVDRLFNCLEREQKKFREAAETPREVQTWEISPLDAGANPYRLMPVRIILYRTKSGSSDNSAMRLETSLTPSSVPSWCDIDLRWLCLPITTNQITDDTFNRVYFAYRLASSLYGISASLPVDTTHVTSLLRELLITLGRHLGNKDHILQYV